MSLDLSNSFFELLSLSYGNKIFKNVTLQEDHHAKIYLWIILTIFFINIIFIPQMLLSSELETETPKSTLIRTNSEEELFQLQERKEQLLQQRKLLKQEARHREIEKLKQEIQELEAGNFSLQQAHEVELTEREKTK
ncbi:hypothetical protein, partial [Candidatus Paracaedibacter symbiosus]|uniref:hypothetical protein n=1 Tax=Candidatus Paracaedibacter symbiosus TaxID=244582 RepID=UPI0005098542